MADTLERRSQVIEILTDAVKAYQAADVMETQGEIYLKNLGMLSDSLDDLKDRHEGAAAKRISCCNLDRIHSRIALPGLRSQCTGFAQPCCDLSYLSALVSQVVCATLE